MDSDKMQALVFNPLHILSQLLEGSEITGDDASELLTLVVAGIEARAARATHAK